MEDNWEMPWDFHTLPCKYEESKSDIFKCESEILQFGCVLCGFETNLKVELYEHFRVFHEEKGSNEELGNILKCQSCKNCNFMTHSMLVLTKHVTDCNTVFRTNWSKKDETKDRFKCAQCPHQSKRKWHLNEHVRTKHGNVEDQIFIKCGECAYKTLKTNNLKRHVIVKHTNPEDINWFMCGQCTYKGKLKPLLKQHVRIKHSNIEERSSNKKWFKCGECAFKALKITDVKRHVIAKHTDPEDKDWFKCEQCTFKTLRKNNLKRHVTAKHGNRENANS